MLYDGDIVVIVKSGVNVYSRPSPVTDGDVNPWSRSLGLSMLWADSGGSAGSNVAYVSGSGSEEGEGNENASVKR
jgi:propanediol dehydratase large subunit